MWDKHWPPLGCFMLWARRGQSRTNPWLPELQLDIQGIWTRAVCDRMGKFFSDILVLTCSNCLTSQGVGSQHSFTHSNGTVRSGMHGDCESLDPQQLSCWHVQFNPEQQQICWYPSRAALETIIWCLKLSEGDSVLSQLPVTHGDKHLCNARIQLQIVCVVGKTLLLFMCRKIEPKGHRMKYNLLKTGNNID